ncbi:MAG: hypothetical protein L3K16_06575 [Thermoplasmata archaeon]|nr:hypothetical protein [Thermoplasmata archaeon]
MADGVLQANTDSVPAGNPGAVGRCYNSSAGSMLAYANWTHVGAPGGWFSYPTVAYGVNSWAYTDGGVPTYTGQVASWALPQRVSAVVNESVWATVNDSFRAPSASDTTAYDFSLDMFLTDGVPSEYEEGPFAEVMVWFAHRITYPSEFSPWSAASLVNSVAVAEPIGVGYWCHGVDNGTNANVSFDSSFGGQSSVGDASGTVGVNLSKIFADVEQRATSVACWTGPTHAMSSIYLAQVNLGSEAGAVGGTSFSYNWTVRSFCLRANASAISAAATGCGTSQVDGGGEVGRAGAPGRSPASQPFLRDSSAGSVVWEPRRRGVGRPLSAAASPSGAGPGRPSGGRRIGVRT